MPEAYKNQYENMVSIYSSTDQKNDLEKLLGNIRTEDTLRSKNVINAERWFKKRFGIRPQTMNWPWHNAANLHMPLTDKTIRRAKPNFANLIMGTYPTVALESNVLGDDQMTVRGIERWFHHLLHDEDKMNIFLPVVWGIDMMMEKGRFIVKVVQEFTPQVFTETLNVRDLSEQMKQFLYSPDTTADMVMLELSMRYNMDLTNDEDVRQLRKAYKQLMDGKEKIEFDREVNLTPFPSLYVRDPLGLLFPNDTTFMVGQARWIRDRITLSMVDLENRVEAGIWDKENGRELVRRIDDNGNSGRYSNAQARDLYSLKQLEQQREGVSPTMESLPAVDEIYHWKKLPGSRNWERMVLTIHPDHPDLPLRLMRYPYVQVNGQPEDWPFVQCQAEIVSDRALAPRGYPQLLDSLQTELTNNHNAKQNWMTIANTLNLKVKRNANVATQWIPGQPLYVSRMDDVQELNIASRDLSFDNEERILKSWAEEYIGILDQTLTNQTGGSERRTKAEIDAVAALQAQVASLDTKIFQACMQHVYNKVWNRVMQYGPETIGFVAQNGEVMQVPKDQIKNRFRLKPTGNIFNSNRQLQSQKYFSIFQSTVGSPYVNQFEALKAWLALEDERLAEAILVPPQELQQNQVERIVEDIMRIKEGYVVVPRPNDDNKTAIAVVTDYLQDPNKRRNFPVDRLPVLKDFMQAHQLAAQKKAQATTRGGRMEQEVANVAQGLEGRAARA